MTRFLASIGTPEEVETALSGGADIIDLKDAATGALGALSLAAIERMLAAVAGRRPVSAVTGDLPMEPDLLRSRVEATAATGVDLVKVGLFPDAAMRDCIAALAGPARDIRVIAVLFADRNPDFALVTALAAAGFAGAMLDTAGKSGGRLTTHLGADRLARFVATCRDHGLLCGLAGGLEPPDVPRLLALRPDVLGFRGALCGHNGRSGPLDPQAVALIRALIPPETPVPATSPAAAASTVIDRIFVRDLVVTMEIGAYSHERGRRQRVSFDVAADIRRTVTDRDDMRQVFSYDVLTDAVHAVVAEGPVQLVETLAERIASRLLAHDAIIRVRIKVEKRDLGPGGVGVEIMRERPPAPVGKQ
jgi:(5-formylfuran-3-yl)methyl phosphate synthase